MIQLAQRAAARVPHLFDLADAAYDAEPIRTACAELGTVAVIDANPRRSTETWTMGEFGREVYKDHSTAERFFSHLLLGTIIVIVEQMHHMVY